MKNRISCFLDMVREVISFVSGDKSQWGSVVVMDDVIKRISEAYELAIKYYRKQTAKIPKSLIEEKEMLFDIMTTHAHIISLKMRSYAQLEEDFELLPKVNYTLATLKAGHEIQVIDRCSIIAEEANARIKKLAAYTLVKDEIIELESDIDRLKKVPPGSSVLKNSGKPELQNLNATLNGLRRSLDILDDMVDCMVKDHEFRRRYHELRRIDDQGHRTFKVEEEKAG